MVRRIVGNLDCEVEFAGNKAMVTLPVRVAKAISAFATLLRAFAREGDSLWTPEPVDLSRLPTLPGLPVPLLESGPLEKLPPALKTLAWAETPAVEKARERRSAGTVERTGAPPVGGLLDECLWELPHSPPDVVTKVNHRAFCLEAALCLGEALPGAALIRSVGELGAHLFQGGASASIDEKWVLKAPHSAAGRSRLKGQGRTTDQASRRRIERLLELQGVLLFEPWMDRLEDFGALALIDQQGVRLLGVHKQEVDSGGVFRGILLPPEGAQCPGLEKKDEVHLESTVEKVGRMLVEAGYRGPFGVDAWRYRSVDGQIKLQALGEINARMSFGLVARGLAERLRKSGALEAGKAVRLRLGRIAPGEESAARGAKVLSLLLPGVEDPSAAWLET